VGGAKGHVPGRQERLREPARRNVIQPRRRNGSEPLTQSHRCARSGVDGRFCRIRIGYSGRRRKKGRGWRAISRFLAHVRRRTRPQGSGANRSCEWHPHRQGKPNLRRARRMNRRRAPPDVLQDERTRRPTTWPFCRQRTRSQATDVRGDQTHEQGVSNTRS